MNSPHWQLNRLEKIFWHTPFGSALKLKQNPVCNLIRLKVSCIAFMKSQKNDNLFFNQTDQFHILNVSGYLHGLILTQPCFYWSWEQHLLYNTDRATIKMPLKQASLNQTNHKIVHDVRAFKVVCVCVYLEQTSSGKFLGWLNGCWTCRINW